MEPTPTWQPWHNRRGKVQGVAIVYRCSDIGLEMKPNGLIEADRQFLCEEIAAALNQAFRKRSPTTEKQP